MSNSTAFLTEVAGQKNSKDNNYGSESFARVRIEHKKLMDVVSAFGQKVANLQDKQRQEYTQAYEHHMINIQKELHALREKATAIANDRTRDEKLKKLDEDTLAFRNEALRLDVVTKDLRKTLRTLTGSLHTVERERDWLLKRLREAKKKYNTLKSDAHSVSDSASFLNGEPSIEDSLASTGMLDVLRKGASPGREDKNIGWMYKLDTDFNVVREDLLFMSKPQLSASVNERQQFSVRPQSTDERKKERARAIEALVNARVKQESFENFLRQCQHSAEVASRRLTASKKKNPTEILQECQRLCDNNTNHTYEDRLSVCSDLVTVPEVYEVLLELMRNGTRLMCDDQVADPSNNDEGVDDWQGHRESFVPPTQDEDGRLVMDDDVLQYLESFGSD